MFNFKKKVPLIIFFILISNMLFGEEEKISYNLEVENVIFEKNFGKLKKDTGSLLILTGATATVLYLLPTSSTGWDKGDDTTLFEKWKNNVKSGPVWDQDSAMYNYVGHMYAGGAYYILARNANYSPLESFWYTFVISTFFWEYGIESFAETPSMQDIVITPVFGSILGEGFYALQNYILENNGMLFNSKFWGSATMIFIDPMGHLSSYIYDDYERTNHMGIVLDSVKYEGRDELLVGINFTFPF